jgi:hypothetical protein
MLMKKIVIISISLMSLLFCGHSESGRTDFKMNIVYYKLGNEKIKEEISVIKINEKNNFLKFIYKYQHLQEDNDTLIILKDSTIFNNTKLSFISKKVFKINNRNYEIKKYLWDAITNTSRIFVNDTLGVVLVRSSALIDNIAEYDCNNDNYQLSKRIVQDTVFFSSRY